MDNHTLYTSNWRPDQIGVRPFFQLVDHLFDFTNYDEKELCKVIFQTGREYHGKAPSTRTYLDSLFDALAITDYLYATWKNSDSCDDYALILTSMELYIKSMLANMGNWMGDDVTAAELHQLEVEIPRVLNRLKEVTF